MTFPIFNSISTDQIPCTLDREGIHLLRINSFLGCPHGGHHEAKNWGVRTPYGHQWINRRPWSSQVQLLLYIAWPRRRWATLCDSKCIWRCAHLTRRCPCRSLLLSYQRLTALVGMQSAADRFIMQLWQRHRGPSTFLALCTYND